MGNINGLYGNMGSNAATGGTGSVGGNGQTGNQYQAAQANTSPYQFGLNASAPTNPLLNFSTNA